MGVHGDPSGPMDYLCLLFIIPLYERYSVNSMFTHSFLDLTRVVLKYILASQTYIKHLLIPLIPYINNIDENYRFLTDKLK